MFALRKCGDGGSVAALEYLTFKFVHFLNSTYFELVHGYNIQISQSPKLADRNLYHEENFTIERLSKEF